jgi:hypothetical protein
MNRQDIHEILQKEPFEPFRIRLSSGDSYEVRDPSSVALMKNRAFIALPDGERWTFCSYLHITAVESLSAA